MFIGGNVSLIGFWVQVMYVSFVYLDVKWNFPFQFYLGFRSLECLDYEHLMFVAISLLKQQMNKMRLYGSKEVTKLGLYKIRKSIM